MQCSASATGGFILRNVLIKHLNKKNVSLDSQTIPIRTGRIVLTTGQYDIFKP